MYLENNDLYCPSQSGYRRHHSCETLLVKMCDDINKDMDKNKTIALLLLDLSSAFDLLDHNILIKKLESDYGIIGDALAWFKSYLNKRSYSVKINSSTSSKSYIWFGVPQGSILGPILFILYTKDLEYIAKLYGLSIQLYADDSQLYIGFSYLNKEEMTTVTNNIEKCLAHIKSWMVNHFMKLNEDKTELLILGKNKVLKDTDDIVLRFLNEEIGQTVFDKDNGKSLGVMLDSNLSMNRHISMIRKSTFLTLSNLRTFGHFLSEDLKITLIKTLILSKLDYSNALYGELNKGSLKRLQSILNYPVRFIYNIKDRSVDLAPYFKKSHILPINLRIKYKVCLLVHNALQGKAPDYTRGLLTLYHKTTGKQTLRNSSDKTRLL